jgi:hypothetical protein
VPTHPAQDRDLELLTDRAPAELEHVVAVRQLHVLRAVVAVEGGHGAEPGGGGERRGIHPIQ